MYRNRLIRAYLGASRNDERRPNLFTGFDPNDNFQLDTLCDSDTGKVQRPLHLLGMALNVSAGARLAWQERKAMPFTASALHCGTHFLGYRPARHYDRPYGISIGTALAISGAAANPNMGYCSSPVVTFLLTLFNARLGVWMQNPGPAGDARASLGLWRLGGARMVGEMLGLADRNQQVVNLSDGGHFDNLGLYEMVLRRCRLIVVSDAGCDPQHQFEDLAIAMHKIRVDLGVEIDFLDGDRIPIYPRSAKHKNDARRFAVARILYSKQDGTHEREDGWLVYLKPAVYGSEPVDVQNYAAQNPSFPHESTVDQFFGESQFESYRRLGLLTAKETVAQLGQVVFGLPGLEEEAA
jgi:hypothetical protein